jgi:hypothetical protein
VVSVVPVPNVANVPSAESAASVGNIIPAQRKVQPPKQNKSTTN